MESLAIVTQVAPSPAAQLYVSGDLTVRQKQALDHKGIDSRYNVSYDVSTNSSMPQSGCCLAGCYYRSKPWLTKVSAFAIM